MEDFFASIPIDKKKVELSLVIRKYCVKHKQQK